MTDLVTNNPHGPSPGTSATHGGDGSVRELLEEIAESVATAFEGVFPPKWVGVIDTSVLLDVIVDSARSRRQSPVVSAARTGLFRVFVTREQLAEVERRLERRARGAKVPVERARELWENSVLPALRVVDVPTPTQERYAAVLQRGVADASIVWLAEIVEADFLWTKDKDILDEGFGVSYSGLTGRALGDVTAADGLLVGSILGAGGVSSVILDLGLTAADGVRASPRWAQLVTVGALAVAAGAVVALAVSRPDRITSIGQKIRAVTAPVGQTVGAVWRERVIAARELPVAWRLRERIDRPSIGAVLARSKASMSTAAIAEATGQPVDEVESALRASSLFTPIGGGWVLGSPHRTDHRHGEPRWGTAAAQVATALR